MQHVKFFDNCDNFYENKNIYLQIDDDLKKYLMARKYRNFGIQYVFAFNNNFGASVVKTPFTYGGNNDLWEFAMLKYIKELYKYELYYCNLTDFSVLGYLSDADVNFYLKNIKNNNFIKNPVFER